MWCASGRVAKQITVNRSDGDVTGGMFSAMSGLIVFPHHRMWDVFTFISTITLKENFWIKIWFPNLFFSWSVVSDSLWPHGHQASLSFIISRSLLKLMSIELATPSNHLIPSPPAISLSQHQGLFQWVSSSHQVTTVLEFQHQSFQWIFRTDFLYDWLVWSPCSPKDS